MPTMAVTPAKTCDFIPNSVLNSTDEERIEFTYVVFVATLQDREAAREAIRADVETACPQYAPLVTRVLGEKGSPPPAPNDKWIDPNA